MARVTVQGTPIDSVIAKASSLLGSYTPASMQKTASQFGQGMIAPQLAAQNAQAQAQQSLLSNLYNRQTGFSLALAKLSQPNAEQASNDYLAAANTMGTLGQGITGAVGADWAHAADQAKAAAAGMTDQGSVQGLYDPGGLQSSGYTTGFALPGQGLAEMAVNAAADARNRQIASANQLGVLAANTQQQQSMTAAENARQLAAIRAQGPALTQQSLQNQQALKQNAWESLANLTGQRASYLQNAAQLAETTRANIATERNAALQTSIAGGYLGQAGAQLHGKVTAQNLANRAATGNLTGYDPVTHNLMAGWILVNGRPVPYSSYVSSITAQARLAMYQDRAAGNIASAQQKLTTTASQLLQAGTNPKKTAPTYSYIPTYTNGKRTGSQAVLTKPGTTSGPRVPYDQMLQSLVALNPTDQKWVDQATKMVNARYPVGTGGRMYSGQAAVDQARKFVADGSKAGSGYSEILQRGIATKVLPEGALRAALARVFPGAYPTPGS